ncbi:hypothetical protein CXB51_014792 [Gossypium anomalum]|uniref:BHLH domain-containing protein n=1 Tax=Gossypium anomalum TaxID=47600 RepID=A0A8J6CXY1_9ROSI|nr:hypothetical protein CXB51_014792 [Gossypium anomalum]
MNRGVLQSSPLQQMTAGNLNWWNINTTMRPPPTTHLQPPSHFLPPSPTNLFPQFTPTPTSSSSSWNDNNQELSQSWSQLLFCRLMGEEEKGGIGQFQVQPKKLENWEEQSLHQASIAISAVDVKQETQIVMCMANKPAWSHQIMATSSALSPKSGVTSFSSKMLEFSGNKADARQPQPERSSECNSSASGGAWKKARVQPSATQSTFKVRKEKLGDRITALHQLVSPFGKTDTASVLLEAIGYIRFLQSQIEALSLPYLGNGSGTIRQQQPVQGERNCIFPEDPGQLLNENSMKRKGGPDQQKECDEEPKDLRSRGLCLVPVSCTLQVGSDNGADYWAPAL